LLQFKDLALFTTSRNYDTIALLKQIASVQRFSPIYNQQKL